MASKKRKLSYDAAQEIAREMIHDKLIPAHITPQPDGKLMVSFFAYVDAEEEVVELDFPVKEAM